MLSVMRKNFLDVECIVCLLSVERLEVVKVELEVIGKMGDESVK